MKIAIINDNNIVSIGNYLELFPNTSFPESGLSDSFMQEQSLLYVTETIPYDSETEKLVSCSPYIDGSFVVAVKKEPLTIEELNTLQANKKEILKNSCITQAQNRLDQFAQTRGYDNILSACTYATSPTAKFSSEGQYCVVQRDATWAKLLEILADVETGIRPLPDNYQEIEPELPLLVWPA